MQKKRECSQRGDRVSLRPEALVCGSVRQLRIFKAVSRWTEGTKFTGHDRLKARLREIKRGIECTMKAD